ncbi:hypothetical protein PVAG01_01780 [Phlyctema vagabunda]|uniref:non-specific serine/threonine protein kinase n=1 Tax=Phlyctema vagabunda TaxID=108571 RepID=A0ABR4PZA0_9HELO
MAAQPPPSSSSSRRSRTGDRAVGSFTIEDEIGKGSFATVYRGRHKPSGALVAVKSVNLAKLNKKLKENLYCEIEILKGLQHPHIVALIDCKESSTHIHLVMEYCELGDLSYFIRKRDKLGDNPALRDMVRKYPNPVAGGLNEVITRHFLKQLASAMEFMRKKNYIHRDVKPQNLLILPSPQYLAKHKDLPLVMSASQDSTVPMVGLHTLPMLKIADFGFARSLPSTSLAETLCGSPLYMAPEILRYEKYDAKADLWSIGTVLFEMVCGRPPFRASNHVELLRKIEHSDDNFKFLKDVVVSTDMQDLVRGLLKRQPVQRLPFEQFFNHPVVVDKIPGLVGDDLPEVRQPSKSLEDTPLGRQPSIKRDRREQAASERDTRPTEAPSHSHSPRDRPVSSSPRIHTIRQASGETPRTRADFRDQARPPMVSAATAPMAPAHPTRTNTERQPLQKRSRESIKGAPPPKVAEDPEQDVRDARDYVLIEKRSIEVNALADQMENMKAPASSRTGQISRRATTQGTPSSVTGAVPPSPSRAIQIAKGRQRTDVAAPQRPNSYGRSFGSPTTAISKALNKASFRVWGYVLNPGLMGGKESPPQLYSPFPVYPISRQVGDGRSHLPIDEDSKAVTVIEESATRSDVVYGFAEVKYKQLIPLTPSMDHGLGGDKTGDPVDDEGLTVDAVVALSEEALVLYVKALSLLAKCIDIASAWWVLKNRAEAASGQTRADHTTINNRINAAVQWVRNRFNEVLEKAEFVRLKLIQAQNQLPIDHPGHPSNHTSASRLASSSSGDVFLSSGITAEKLMYDRAIEMSRSAAINEIANEDLPGCEISYVTAIRMLEAVLENDDEDEDDSASQPKRTPNLRAQKDNMSDDSQVSGINLDDREAVQKVISTIRTRLHTVRKKIDIIAKHQAIPQSSSPRPASAASSGTTPTVARSPPQ